MEGSETENYNANKSLETITVLTTIIITLMMITDKEHVCQTPKP